MATLYPMGYGYQVGTIDQMMKECVEHHHPEYVRRLRAWLIAQNGTMGIGDAWRAPGAQPDRNGFAPEGLSFHQDQRFRSGFVGGCAVDLVVLRAGAAHRSPYWKEVPRSGTALAKLWGLHCFIDGEPWHMQPIEIRGHQSWVNAGRPDPQKGYKIPTPTDTPPLITNPPPPTLRLGVDNAHDVRWLQQIMNERFGTTLTVDGGFGPATEAGVKRMQGILSTTVDGVYGPVTASKLAEWLAAH